MKTTDNKLIKNPTAEQAAKLLGVSPDNVRKVYQYNAEHLWKMAGQAALRKSKTYRGFSESYLRERAASYAARAKS